MGIKQNINDVIDQATADSSGTICNEISYSAVKAILNGIGSRNGDNICSILHKTRLSWIV